MNKDNKFSKIIDTLHLNENPATSQKGSFCATHTLTPKDIQISVDGIGTIDLPLNLQTIQKLQLISTEAKYGQGEKTLLDKTVRDTSEITQDKLSIRYSEAFSKLLERCRNALGLSENCKLSAHLHNMLIYKKGQFFKEHQDTEKLDGMIATLVVALPSAHIGGNLVIKHNNESFRFKTENLGTKDIQCVAFYADCPHKVEKVTDGHRVTLTYNLVLQPLENHSEPKENKALLLALKEFFSSPKEPTSEQKPKQLIYFLDHSYTEHSLGWNMLKGVDQQRAAEFRYAARKLDLIPHLALVEIEETWATDGSTRNPDLEELIDGRTILSDWIDANNQKLPYEKYSVSNQDICWSKRTDEFKPIDSEYEGYMGNYGNTASFWYRRTAIVLWPATEQIIMDFKLDYTTAINKLLELTKSPKNKSEVLHILQKVGNALYGGHPNCVKSTQFSSLAHIAIYIEDANLAQSLLSCFSLGIYTEDVSKEIFGLQSTYGVTWVLELMALWEKNRHQYQAFDPEKTITRLLSAGVDKQIALYLLNFQTSNLTSGKMLTLFYTLKIIKENEQKRVSELKLLFNACDILKDSNLAQKLLNHVIANTLQYPESALTALILESNTAAESSSIYSLLRDYITLKIKQELDKGIRNPEDHSIEAQLDCSCDHCKTAMTFLNSKTEITKVWPIVKPDREHIMNIFKKFDIPVTCSVEKTGSPHKLILTKSDHLYEDSKKQFEELSQNYEKLMQAESCLCSS